MALPVLVLGLFLLMLLAHSNVAKVLTEEDKTWIPRFLELSGVGNSMPVETYEDQVACVKNVQRAVLHIAENDTGIPLGSRREPKDVLLARVGACYDRSRVIEKILQFHGFRVRHIFIYYPQLNASSFKALLKRGNPSHAVSEVLTKKGWLVVGTRRQTLSLDVEGNPVGISTIQARGVKSINWSPQYDEAMTETYAQPFGFCYGLYSRHGKFFPPYNAIPDINWSDFFCNLGEMFCVPNLAHLRPQTK